MTNYVFATLDTSNTVDAAIANNKLFAENNVLGIEVTMPALAVRCGLGNLDHHGPDAGKPAAIQQALECALPNILYVGCYVSGCHKDPAQCLAACMAMRRNEMPTVLATVKPDLDSVGAMALLDLRTEARTALDAGLCNFNVPRGEELEFCGMELKALFRDDVMQRIQKIADADTAALAASAEWQPHDLPSRDNPWPSTVSIDGNRELAAIAAAVADFKVPLETRVEAMKRWLLTGEEPAEYREKVEKERQNMIEALENDGLGSSSHRAQSRVPVRQYRPGPQVHRMPV